MEVTLNGHRLLARLGDWRLWLLNAEAACLWDWHRAGLNGAAMAVRISHEYGLDIPTARRQVHATLNEWRRSDLLRRSRPPASTEGEWNLPEAIPVLWPAETWPLRMADHTLGLCLEPPHDLELGPELRANLLATCQPEDRESDSAPPGPLLRLCGPPHAWRLFGNGQLLEHGQSREAALLAVLRELIEHGCRAANRLLVVHGAGLVGPDGSGLLLIGPGGSGKTTLAAALNAKGWPMLHDDVVPVDLDGRLLGLGLPITLKAGSWPVLESLRPDLQDAPIRQRFGQSVRLLRPHGQPPTKPVPTGSLIFSRYQPDSPGHCQRINPEAALKGLIEAEAVIRQLTQHKLERLARWLESAPAWSLSYPDLDSGLTGVREIQAMTQTRHW